jgi:hypothetical protein
MDAVREQLNSGAVTAESFRAAAVAQLREGHAVAVQRWLDRRDMSQMSNLGLYLSLWEVGRPKLEVGFSEMDASMNVKCHWIPWC